MEYQLSHLLSHYGYLGIIIALAGGIIGLPLPDEVIMTFVGYQVFKGNMSYAFAVSSAFLGASIGMSTSYFLGYKLGLPFLKKYLSKIYTEEKAEKIHTLFRRYGSFWIIFGFFIPGVRNINGYLSGIANLGLLKFGLVAYVGALIWSITYISIGYRLGEEWYLIQKLLGPYQKYSILILFFICFLVFLIYLLIKKILAKKTH